MRLRATVIFSLFLALPLIFADVSYSADATDGASVPKGVSARTLRKADRKNVSLSAFTRVCASVSDLLPGQGLGKGELSQHITNPGDSRTNGYTLVCGSQCPRNQPATAYYSDGTEAFRVGYYGTFSGNGQPRLYCGAGGAASCNVSSISSNSRKNGRDGKVYIQFSSARTGSKTSCKRVTPTGRTGAV